MAEHSTIGLAIFVAVMIAWPIILVIATRPLVRRSDREAQ